MRSRFNAVIVLVYMAIGLSVLGYLGYKMAGNCVLAKCQTFNIEFKDASGLLKTNDVRIAGVMAGRVLDVKADGNMAIATVQIDEKYTPVYKDAHAIVRPKNLLGETYVEIDSGHPDAGSFSTGDTIKLVNTITPVQIDEVLNALDPDTRTKLAIVVNSLGEAAAGRGQDLSMSTVDLRRIAADLAVTSTTLNQQKDNIDSLLVQFDLMQQTAADFHQQLAQVLADWNTVSTTFMNRDAQLASALGHLSNVLGDLDTALTPNTRALTSMVSRLPTTVDHANDFLSISSQVMQSFYNAPGPGNTTSQAFASTVPGTNPGSSLQDAVALFPRLAQVMQGINTCDMHIYANGYYNIPGVTEPSSCPNPVDANGNATDPSLSGEIFTGHPANNTVPTDRHLFRVMGMSSTADIPCALALPTTRSLKNPPTTGDPALEAAAHPCSVQANTTTGFEKYQSASPFALNTGGSGGNFLQQLWNDLFGNGHA